MKELQVTSDGKTKASFPDTALMRHQKRIISLRIHNGEKWALCADGAVWYKPANAHPVNDPWVRIPNPNESE
jgi:hypothetical protein